MAPTSPASTKLSRARAQIAVAPLLERLPAAAASLTRQLVALLDDSGDVSVKAVYEALFPMASPAAASAQLSRLKAAIEAAAGAEGRVLAVRTTGARSAGVAKRGLHFAGPAAALVADTETLRATPPERLVEGQQGTLLVSEPRVVLITFNEHEFAAVRAAFWSRTDDPPVRRRGEEANCDDLGWHGDCVVLHHHARQGNRHAQRAAEALRAAHEPHALIAVGIAFGIDEGKQAFGDVLVSTFIVDYELAKAHPGRLVPRGPRPPASRRLVDALRQLDVRMKAQRAPWPTLRFGGLLSGEKLIDSLDYREQLTSLAGQDDLVGGEMEAAGIATALEETSTPWIVVKAICDFADGRKSRDKATRQKDAAASSALVVKALVDSGSFLAPQPERTTARREMKATAASLLRWRAAADDAAACAGPWIDDQAGFLASLETIGGSDAQPEEGGRARVEATADLRRWLDDPDAPPHYALLGEYGMGKTTTCQRLAEQLQTERDAGHAVRPVLYFDLRKVQRVIAKTDREPGHVPTLREAIEDCLRHGYLHADGDVPRYEQVTALVDDGALVIFDGLDEVLARLADAQGLTFTANLLKTLPESAARRGSGGRAPRVLLSCRTQFFRTLREQSNHLTGQHRGAAPASQYRALVLLPLGDAQIKTYLAAAFPKEDAQALLDRIASVHDLRDLAQRPFTLSLVARFVPRIEAWRAQGRSVTGATLYREVAREWLIRDQEKQSFRPEDKERLASELAAELWGSAQRGLAADALESWLSRWLARQDPHADFQRLPRELLQEDLRNSTFLKRRDDPDGRASRFEFAHTSLLEFFLADHLLRALQRDDRAAWHLPRVSDETLDFLGQMLAEDRAPLATLDRWRSTYAPEASEMHLAYALRAHRRGWPMPMLAGIDLRGADLTGWRFGSDGVEGRRVEGRADGPTARASAPKLDASGARFDGATLRRTRWFGVRLRGARFDAARLAQAEVQHCDLEGAAAPGAEVDGMILRACGFGGEEPIAIADAARWRDGEPSPRSPPAPPAASLAHLAGHSSIVNACAFSPDGRSCLSGSGDGTLRLWDAASGACLRVLQGHEGGVTACAFSPDGRSCLSASRDRTLRLWDAASGACLRVLQGHEGGVTACAFSPDGRSCLSASDDRTLRLWDAASGACLRVHLAAEGGSAAWVPGARELLHASGSAWRTLRWRDADDAGWPRVWPLESGPAGAPTVVGPWPPAAP